MTLPYYGEIRLVAFNFAPPNWALCNGQTMPIQQNSALFSLLGTQYGGDGVTTFKLPDLRGRTPIHTGFAVSGTHYTMGQTAGEENHTLVTNEYPAHVHPLTGDSSTPATSNFASPFGTSLGAVQAKQTPGAAIPFAFYSDSAGNTTLDPHALASNSGGQSHSNQQPYLVMNHIIALTGIFPARG